MKRGSEKIRIRKRPGRPPGSKNKTTDEITLNRNELLFANLICENLLRSKKDNLTNWQCYKIAYPGVKDSSAKVLSSLLYTTPRIQEYVQKRKQQAAKKAEVHIKDVLLGLLRIAKFDHRKLLTDTGKPIQNLKNMDDSTALAIAGLDWDNIAVTINDGKTKEGKQKTKRIVRTYLKSIKTESRLRAWELLGQYLNMFNGRIPTKTAQEYVNDVRQFADLITNGVPGGKV